MKKCPYCHSEIQSDAVFCLYCMTSLDEKTEISPRKTQRRSVLAVLLTAFAFTLLIWIVICKILPYGPSAETVPSVSTAVPEIMQSQVAPSTTVPPVTEANPPVTEPPLPAEEVFTFRKAMPEDYADPRMYSEADYVITGVKVQQEVYYIPYLLAPNSPYMIVGIAADAFYGSGAKAVYASTRLEFIQKDAFRDCELTDLYLATLSNVTLDPMAFESLGTLHTRYEVRDETENKPFSQTAQSVYHAKWEEWNPEQDGIPLSLLPSG